MGPGDVSGDGIADILGRSGGNVYLYPGDNSGRLDTRSLVSNGWNAPDAMIIPGNWNRANGNDLLTREGGALWFYPGNNAGGFLTRSQIGNGWQVMTYIG